MCFAKFAVILCLGLVSVQAAEECGIEKSSNLIHHNPWLVYIMYFSGEKLTHARCGGSLLDGRHVLTAAHCVTGAKKTKFTHLKARLGEYDLDTKIDCVNDVCNNPVLDIDVEKVFVHPGYDGKEHDMAILRLKEPAPYTDFIRPVCLPTGDLSDDAFFIASGWGIIPRVGDYTSVKKIIPLPFVKHETCQSSYHHSVIPKMAICAGGEPDIDTCSGDSGGPLVWVKDRIEIWGVTSSGNVHCGTKGTPGIYMSVKDHLDWIKEVTD